MSWVKLLAFVIYPHLALAADTPSTALLSRRIEAISIRKQTRLVALIQAARANRIPIGIEYDGRELNEQITMNVPATGVQQAIRQILGPTRQYSVSVAFGCVSIRPSTSRSPRWLEQRIPQFRLPRTTLAIATNHLWIALERQLEPNVRGWVGDFPPGDPNDQVGPFDLRGAAVREILNRLVSASGQSVWVITLPGASLLPPASVNPFWTTTYRADPLSELPPIPPPPQPIAHSSPDMKPGRIH